MTRSAAGEGALGTLIAASRGIIFVMVTVSNIIIGGAHL